MMKGPLREALPVGPLRLRIRIPDGLRPRRVQLLTAGTSSSAQPIDGVLTVTVPSVEVHEVVAIDL
jgi:hypothetical protein